MLVVLSLRTCVSVATSHGLATELCLTIVRAVQTDTRVGLTSEEVLQRRKKYGLNQMKEEKENMILKFFSYFVGPIQFVMEVRASRNVSTQRCGVETKCPTSRLDDSC